VVSIEETKEIVWFRNILKDFQEKQVNATPLLIENNFAIKLAKNPRFHDLTNNINTKYHLIQHRVEAKTFHWKHCSTSEKCVDIFTKVLRSENIEKFRKMIRLTNNPSD